MTTLEKTVSEQIERGTMLTISTTNLRHRRYLRDLNPAMIYAGLGEYNLLRFVTNLISEPWILRVMIVPQALCQLESDTLKVKPDTAMAFREPDMFEIGLYEKS